MSADIGFSLNVVNRNVPLDPRVVVDTENDLSGLSSYYKGMMVLAKDTNQVYVLNVEPSGTLTISDWTLLLDATKITTGTLDNARLPTTPTFDGINFNTLGSGDWAKLYTEGTDETENNNLQHRLVLELGDDAEPADFVIRRFSDNLEMLKLEAEYGDLEISRAVSATAFNGGTVFGTTFTATTKVETNLIEARTGSTITMGDTTVFNNGFRPNGSNYNIIWEGTTNRIQSLDPWYIGGSYFNPPVGSSVIPITARPANSTDIMRLYESEGTDVFQVAETFTRSYVNSYIDGKVGIGTTTPEAKLHIETPDVGAGAGSSQIGLSIKMPSLNNDRILFYSYRNVTGSTWTSVIPTIARVVDGTYHNYIRFDGDYTRIGDFRYGERMTINNNDGKVGIGTTVAPTERLEVNGNVKADRAILNSLELDDGNLEIYADDGFSIKGGIGQIENKGVNFIGHRTTLTDNAGVTRLKLNGPTSAISLGASDKWNITATTGSDLSLKFSHYSNSSDTEFLIKNEYPGSTTTNGEAILHLSTSSQAKDSIIYLGTPFDSSSPPKCAIIAKARNDWSRADLFFCVNNDANNTDKVDKDDVVLRLSSGLADVVGDLLVEGDGYIGGKGGPTLARPALSFVDINHPTLCTILPAVHKNSAFSLSNGAVDLGSTLYRFRNIYLTNAPNYPSDDRLKHNEEEVVDALGTINKLKLYKYDKTVEMLDEDFNGDLGDIDHKKEIGFIAQEVEEIPELAFLVSGEGDELRSLDYQGINNLAIQAIQELSAEVTRLRRLVEGTPQTAS